MESKYVQHPSGVWQDKVNFIIHISGEYDEGFIVKEQVGTRSVSSSHVELCCLPFYVYGYTLGDILEISPETFQVKGIHKKSGRFLYRIMFSCSNADVIRIADQCKGTFDALFEWYNSTLCAVDIATEPKAILFVELMNKLSSEGLLEFESG